MWKSSLKEFASKRGCKAKLAAIVLGIIGLIIVAICSLLDNVIHEGQSQIPWRVIVWFTLIKTLAFIIHHFCTFGKELFHCGTKGTISFVLMILFSVLVWITLNGIEEIMSDWLLYFGITAACFITSLPRLTENSVEFDIFLDDCLKVIGSELAYSYYYGFLKIILPPIPTDVGPGWSIEQRAVKFAEHNKIELFSTKLFILVPDSCNYQPKFEDMWPGKINTFDKLEDVVVTRAGVKGRPYPVRVYEVLNTADKTSAGNQSPTEQRNVYAIIDMPSILLALHEMNDNVENPKLSPVERSWQTKEFCRVLKHLLDSDPLCKDLCEIKYYQDKGDMAPSPFDLITRTDCGF